MTGGRPTDRMKKVVTVGTVILPMPKNIADNNTVSFSGDKMNALQAAGTSVIGGILSDNPVNATQASLLQTLQEHLMTMQDNLKIQ